MKQAIHDIIYLDIHCACHKERRETNDRNIDY